MTPERLAAIDVAVKRMLAAEQKRVASHADTLKELAKEAPNWTAAELLFDYERGKSK
jgi:hypothetical protein